MITLGIIFHLIARSASTTDIKRFLAFTRWSDACFDWAIGLTIFFMLFELPVRGLGAEASGIVFAILVTLLIIAIILRLKLNVRPTGTNKVAKNMPAMANDKISSSEINYKALANELFDVSLELTNLAGGQLANEGAARYSMGTINTATMYGTGLYEYSALLLRERMKKIYPNKSMFEAEDNKMVEIFANRIQIPVPAFLKIIDRSGGIKKWEQELKKETKLPMDEYMDEVRVIVNKATRGLAPLTKEEPDSAVADFEKHGEGEEDGYYDDGL